MFLCKILALKTPVGQNFWQLACLVPHGKAIPSLDGLLLKLKIVAATFNANSKMGGWSDGNYEGEERERGR